MRSAANNRSPGHSEALKQSAEPAKNRVFSGPKLGTFWGVEVALDWSVLLIFALIAYNLGAGVFPRWHPDWSAAVVWGSALATAALFLLSILLHELAHALVGRRQGIVIRRITLFLFGGVAHLEGEAKSPKAEFLMAIAGPACSLVIGGVALALGTLLAGPSLETAVSGDAESVVTAFQQIGPLPTILLWLGPINVMLAIFNLVPGFPLDGGRVLRSALWAGTRDIKKATRWASGVGRGIAWALMAWGIFLAFGGQLLSGLWLVLIGWFLSSAATASYQQVLTREVLDNVAVDSVMRTEMLRVEPHVSLATFVNHYLMAAEQRAFPVETDGVLVGLVCLDDVRRVPRSDWDTVTVSQIMTPIEKLATVTPGSDAQQVLQQLNTRRVNQIPVVRDRRLVGMIQRADILKWLEVHGQENRRFGT